MSHTDRLPGLLAELLSPWEGIQRKPPMLGPDRVGGATPPAALLARRDVFVLSASLQCCLVAFRSSSIVQGYERTKNGLPLSIHWVLLPKLVLVHRVLFKVAVFKSNPCRGLKKETSKGTKDLSQL